MRKKSEARDYTVTVSFRVREGPFYLETYSASGRLLGWSRRRSFYFVKQTVRDAIASMFGKGFRKLGHLHIDIRPKL